MGNARLDVLRNMLAPDPGNSFARYGVAMELANTGRLDEAVGEYETLIEANPDMSLPIITAAKRWRS